MAALKTGILAKIFTRKITTWDHADILDSNPGFCGGTHRRSTHSSSTSLISQYLYKSCPSVWDIGVGKGEKVDSSNPTVPTKPPDWDPPIRSARRVPAAFPIPSVPRNIPSVTLSPVTDRR